MEFKVPEHLRYLIISISLDANHKLILIKFGVTYDNAEIISPFDTKDIPNSMEKLEKKIKKTIVISKEEYNEIENIILSEFSGNTGIDLLQLSDKKTNKKEVTVNKYSQNRKGDLFEAVLIQGKPYFMTVSNENNMKEFRLVSKIEESTRILIPPSIEEYLHEPYEFESQTEIESYMEKAEKETIFSLFTKIKSIVSKFIDQEEHIINLLATNIVFSHHQDRFNTVHYVGIFGDNGTGKSSIGDVFEALAYRAMNTTDPTVANIFRALGSVEPGQLTLILDEAEKVDQNPEMMSILKTGYDYRKTVSRINQNTGKPERFFTYCFKMIIGERPPSLILAKGVNDRILGDTVYYGNPQYDIKEVLNPTDTGGEGLKKLLDEINVCRKILFAYRILHFRGPIPNIALKISGRNKELVKPNLQLFSNIKIEEDKQIYGQIENTFAKLLQIKNEKKTSTLEFALMPIVLILMEESTLRKPIKFSDLWELLQYHIKGKLNENKPNEYNTEDYGTIYRNSVTPTLHKLGVKTKHCNSFTELLFDHKKIRKTASQYGFIVQEKIDGNNNSERSERGEGLLDPYGGKTGIEW
jgi:hypothetical protein